MNKRHDNASGASTGSSGTGSGEQGTITAATSTKEGGHVIVQRQSPIPITEASPSSIFYRNRKAKKSSRSIHFDLRHIGEDDSEEDDDDDEEVGRNISSSSSSRQACVDRGGNEQPRIFEAQRESNPVLSGENRPLLFTNLKDRLTRDVDQRVTRIAAAFLNDYEAGQAPTLPPDLSNIKEVHLRLHAVRFSIAWRLIMAFSTACLFISSCFEGSDGDEGWESYEGTYLLERIRRKERIIAICTIVPVLVYAIDIMMMATLLSKRQQQAVFDLSHKTSNDQDMRKSTKSINARTSRSMWWSMPVALVLTILSVETVFVLRSHTILQRRIWSSALKPFVLFYMSSKTRNALDAINRVIRIVVRVILIEIFLIFTFSAVAVQLYGDFESFSGLPISFLSMFQLSTTVVNPSLWMPVVGQTGRSSSIFFVIFLITSVFYLHSLVLSVVFQSYMDGMSAIRKHAELDREKSLQLSYQALVDDKSSEVLLIPTHRVRNVLQVMRPHYNALKIDVLMRVLDPANSGSIDFKSFRLQVPKALNLSVHSKRPYNFISHLLEMGSGFVAVVNLVYVVLASSASFHPHWWNVSVVPIGFAITSQGIIELAVRLVVVKILRLADAAAAGKPDITFDSLAMVAALTSMVGLAFYRHEDKGALDYIFAGRAIDMVRCLRLNSEARGIVKRSTEVIPSLTGPILLIVSAMHLFIYIGFAIWGGAVVYGSNPDVNPYYDLNNFNSYLSGQLTLFAVLVVNDWHEIAKVFVIAGRATNSLVYPYFVIANITLTSVLLNVMIAFFVNSFVTKATQKDMLIGTSSNQSDNIKATITLNDSILSSGSTASEVHQLVTISERQGYDNILKTIARETDEADANSARLCSVVLELFEEISLATDKVGYLVDCNSSKQRYGNQRIENLMRSGGLNAREMHQIIGEMAAHLHEGDSKFTVRRTFHVSGTQQVLDIQASLLEEGSSISLFVCKLT